MNKKGLFLVLTSLGLVLGLLFFGHVALAASLDDCPPDGNLILVVNEQMREVVADGDYANAAGDWNACLFWGDTSEMCFPGTEGDFFESHVFAEYGEYTVTLVVTGTEGTTPFKTERSVHFSPPIPTGDMNVSITDISRLQVQAVGEYSNAANAWDTCIDWGDETSKCFEPTDGVFDEFHEFTTYGTYTVTLTVAGVEETFIQQVHVEFVKPPDPTGSLVVAITNVPQLQVQAEGSYVNAAVWGSTLDWGDGTGELFPGPDGVFSEPHQYQSYGTYTVTLTVVGVEGTIPYKTQQVVVIEPPPPQMFSIFLPTVMKGEQKPWCSIDTKKITSHLVATEVSWGGFPQDWSFLFWGDESSTGAEPVGFWGPSGTQSWSHVYNNGLFTQEVKVLEGNTLKTICTLQVVVP